MECVHYWIIETAEGPVASGVCKHCKATQDFKNSNKDTEVWKDARHPEGKQRYSRTKC
ncbi:hypothetical protein LCGC14_1461880 [marine sediment metagenome]|uniref:Uncharacterized protein n=1 Tax=marine sediment metagenome TaxID=412755 RepID=A0A0F9JFG5_9ZZZZ